MELAIILALYNTVLQLVNGWTTVDILGRGGVELNPVVRELVKGVGILQGTIIAKLVAIFLIWALAAFAPAFVQAFIALGYTWVAYHNYGVAKRMRAKVIP